MQPRYSPDPDAREKEIERRIQQLHVDVQRLWRHLGTMATQHGDGIPYAGPAITEQSTGGSGTVQSEAASGLSPVEFSGLSFWYPLTGGTVGTGGTLGSGSPQFARPDADFTGAGWLKSAGSTFYELLDEAVPDDADYAYRTIVNPIGFYSELTCELSTVTNPGVDGGHIMRVRHRATNHTNALIQIYLSQAGVGAIATRTVTPSSSFTTDVFTLTDVEAANISNYGALSITFGFDVSVSGSTTFEVSWFELQVPGA